ncbi:galectin-12 [Marmota marmota marmota]|uniref:galectin-12 n=1 Tax=Marmota marmota marmota TaxID=9994 RepID=UPI000762A0F9|nr:galectin-12 [Marmota marmota marmota]
MSPGENLDPIPDCFILQPPVFHPPSQVFLEAADPSRAFTAIPLFLQQVPCSRALPQGLWPGQVIIVRGLVLQEPKEFTLSLRDEASRTPVMLRASFTDRKLAWVSPWGFKKLISAPFLFYPQRFFEVLLLCQEGGLKLALNGQPLGSTNLDQQTLERLREVRISGSIQLYCVHY